MKTINNHKACLVLNIDYSPISIINWKTAMSWYFKIKDQKTPAIEIIQFYSNDTIIGSNKNFQLPCVIKINRYVKTQRQSVKFTRKNLFLRDNNICQYCGKKYSFNKLTYDHVIPKCKWYNRKSATSWTNIVTACASCNRKKGDKTLKEAGMELLNIPKQPNFNLRYLPWYADWSRIEYRDEWSTFIPQEFYK